MGNVILLAGYFGGVVKLEKFVKKQLINALREGDSVDDIFVVKMKKGVSEYKNGYSFELLVSDSSGKSLNYKYWGGQGQEKVKAVYDSIKADSVVHVQGKTSTYNGKLQLATNEPMVIEALAPGQFDEGAFIKPAKKDLDEMYKELLGFVEKIENSKLKDFVKSIFTEPGIESKFRVHPAAIEIHHNWVGGLLEHTLETAKYCELTSQLFPGLDRDLLIAGALLHDIGKLGEIEVTSRIKGTRQGQLEGHIAMGHAFLSKRFDSAGLGNDLKGKMLHMMLNHHGKNEFGSPKTPMFPEALAVYYADEISSKVSEMACFIEDSKDETEDDFMYNRRHQKNILLR